MGEIITLHKLGPIIEHFTAVKHYESFGDQSLVLATTLAESTPIALALVLDGLGPEVGFEVLCRMPNTDEGRALADQMARAVSLALMHLIPD